MQRIVVIFALILGPQFLWAQPTLQSVSPKSKPVSVSYENLLRCFPELADDTLSFKVDLNRLKELIDEKFVTSNSLLRQRKIQFLDASGHLTNLILRTKQLGAKKFKTELSLQRVDEKGVVTDLRLTENQRINPKQEVINSFLLGANVKSDRFTYLDTKLNGVSLVYQRNFKVVEELELVDPAGKRSVSCESPQDLGIICTCSKK